ncbi:hypothetical protein MLD38_015841 [Melastoma candidum]|uniref:Uncharacterized protein n=1 Tax=Melastoma candidum TaxID=119954 RepID=A0ACB9RI31_9MYRT|nr:hypothetical protein MLD38_015841 [Melastoma candidum]
MQSVLQEYPQQRGGSGGQRRGVSRIRVMVPEGEWPSSSLLGFWPGSLSALFRILMRYQEVQSGLLKDQMGCRIFFPSLELLVERSTLILVTYWVFGKIKFFVCWLNGL